MILIVNRIEGAHCKEEKITQLNLRLGLQGF